MTSFSTCMINSPSGHCNISNFLSPISPSSPAQGTWLCTKERCLLPYCVPSRCTSPTPGAPTLSFREKEFKSGAERSGSRNRSSKSHPSRLVKKDCKTSLSYPKLGVFGALAGHTHLSSALRLQGESKANLIQNFTSTNFVNC